jgi:hypothetical protein
MRVRLSTSLLWEGYWFHSGDEINLPDELARKYIAGGSADLIEPPIETAALRTQPAKGHQDASRTTTTRKAARSNR